MKKKLTGLMLLVLILPFTVFGKEVTFNAAKALKGMGNSVVLVQKTKEVSLEKDGDTYTVVFDKNTGTGTMANQEFTVGTSQNINANTYAKTGYTFNGWNTMADGSGVGYSDGQAADDISLEADVTVTLYAQWEANRYTIEYLSNGGTGTMTKQVFIYDQEQDLAILGFENAGHEFIEWNTKKDGSGDSYGDQETVLNITDQDDATIRLYARWSSNEFTVEFNNNGGEGEMAAQDFTYGEAQELTANAFTKEHYGFIGWNTQADGSGESYTNGQDGSQICSEDGGVVTLYAQWAAEKYTVTFYSNDGTGSMEPQEFEYGVSQRLTKNAFEKEGQTFTGWNTQVFGTGDPYTDEQEIQIDSNMNLYAQWGANTYTIQYNSNEGEGTMSNQVIEVGDKKPLTPNAFTKLGHHFKEWNTQADGSGDSYADKEEVQNIFMNDGESLTLYAQWEVNTYTVEFYANGGQGEKVSQEFTYGVWQKLQANEFTKETFRFDRWTIDEEGNEQAYADQENVLNLTDENEGVVKLYAQWANNMYTVHFDKNTGTGTMNDQELEYGVSEKLTANSFTNEGKTFVEWNTMADGSGSSYADEAEVTEVNATVNDEVTLYAQWRVNTYTVHFNANGGDGEMADQDYTHGVAQELKVHAFQRTRYEFTGWNTKADGSGTAYEENYEFFAEGKDELEGYLELYAQWEGIHYTVRFNGNGGEGEMPDQEFVFGTAQALTANTFTLDELGFSEWNTSEDGTGTSYEDGADLSNLEVNPGDVINLYAQWTTAQYQVTFNANGGSGFMANQTITYGETVELSANEYVRPGYSFNGWNTDPEAGGVNYTDRQTVVNLSSTDGEVIELYALWKVNTYTIAYDANGGEGTMANQLCTYDIDTNLATLGFTREGYTFKHWNTKADDNGTVYTKNELVKNLTTENKGTVTLYAIWEGVPYQVAYDANGGEGEMDPQAFVYGTAQNLTANTFTKEENNFDGWNTEADGSGDSYVNEENVKDLTSTKNDTVTLYAQWRVKQYSVKFKANGGEGEMEDLDFDSGAVETITANAFTKVGSSFAGWNTDPEGNGTAYEDEQSIADLTFDSDNTVVLYAQWTGNSYTVVFDGNGADNEVEMPAQEFVYGESQDLSKNLFTKTGAAFIGWNTAADGSGSGYTDEENVSDLTEEANATVTLYAQWLENAYTVHFNANGADGEMADQVFTYGETKALTANAFTKVGYTFGAWSTTIDPTEGEVYLNEEEVTKLAENDGDIVDLYAIWVPNLYVVEYDPNGGTGEMNSQLMTYDEAKNLLVNEYTYEGHNFIGWSLTEDGSGDLFADGAEVINLTEMDDVTVTLYAQWSESSEADGIELSVDELGLVAGDQFTIVATVTPENAADKTVTWASTRPDVASVDENGVVTAIADGITMITATTVNGYEANCIVMVGNIDYKVSYNTHIQDIGWQGYLSNGQMAGTSGESKRLEGIKIKLEDMPFEGSIEYRTHIQDYGWESSYKKDDEMSGTHGQSKRLEAIQIRLTGEVADYFDVYYRVHAEQFGWLGWARNDEVAGTSGFGYRLEGIEIVLVEKGMSFLGYDGSTSSYSNHLTYRTHVQDYGWQEKVPELAISGTVGQAKRLEAIEIKKANNDLSGNIEYRTHIQDYGWEKDFKMNGAMSGTSGQGKRLEAIQIRLTGELEELYDVYYKVHAENVGWMAWAKNGESAGTAGYGYRLEGIMVVLVPKGQEPPVTVDNTNNVFIEK